MHDAQVAEPSSTKSTSEPAIHTVDVLNFKCTKHGAQDTTVPLQAGPGGFLIAEFGSSGTYVTELPNLLIKPGVIAVPKPKVCKRPAAAKAKPKAKAKPSLSGPRYAVLWYKNGHNIGIRETFGLKKQIFAFGGKSCTKTERQLRDLAAEIINDLAGGMDSSQAKTKARELAAA